MIHLQPFKGLFTNASPHALPEGSARVQDNLECRVPGQLDCRPGTAPVTFANAGSQVTGADWLSNTAFKAATGWQMVGLLSDGKLRMGRGPSV